MPDDENEKWPICPDCGATMRPDPRATEDPNPLPVGSYWTCPDCGHHMLTFSFRIPLPDGADLSDPPWSLMDSISLRMPRVSMPKVEPKRRKRRGNNAD